MHIFIKIISYLLLFSLAIDAYAIEFVGIHKYEFEKHYRPQLESQWCWAASTEMVLSFQGLELNQQSIVERIKGKNLNTTANILEMFRSTNALLEDSNGQEFVISGQLLKGLPSPTVLYNYLKQQKPIILIYEEAYPSKHAVVLTGMDVEVDSNRKDLQQIKIKALHIFDPYPQLMAQVYAPPKYYASKLDSTHNQLPGIVSNTILIDMTQR